ncbi:MAG: response regulator [Oscillochloris sp.]|nr:response regulator [Oscillochloris sp.]
MIILDYQLPTISGSDVIRQLRAWAEQSGQTLPSIVLTSSQPDVAVFARALRVAAFLPKPVLGEQIEQVIEPLLLRSVAEPALQPKLWRLQPRNN